MTEVTSYHNPTAPDNRKWIAYVVLGDGKLWGVYATAESQGMAEVKIARLWESERARLALNPQPSAYKPEPKPAQASLPASWENLASGVKSDGRGHGTKGMVWLIGKTTRLKCRVSPEVAEGMIANGDWERGGPRSK